MFGISVDGVERNAAMVDKLLLPFPLLADPDAGVIRKFGLFNAGEKGGIAIPAILVVGPDGVLRYAYEGADFADRPGDAPVFEALEQTGGRA